MKNDKRRQPPVLNNIHLQKFVHGGQVLAVDEDGKKLLVWGGLPGELVDVKIIKKKRSYQEGIVSVVHQPSSERVSPKEPESYLSTSPWQIVSWSAENEAKQAILEETFSREGVKDIPWEQFYDGTQRYGYRNKIEIGFWGDDEGLHLAHFVRGTHGKQKVQENALAMPQTNKAAQDIRDELRRLNIWAGDLKTVIIRSSQKGATVAALFIKKQKDFSDFQLPKSLHGMDVYFSEPKSPASVPTRKIYSYGDTRMTDTLQGIEISYDVLSFFQVNLAVFEQVLKKISALIGSSSAVDFYSGVGAIGIPVGARVLVESDTSNAAMARTNVGSRTIKVVAVASEKALEHITNKDILIVDPPRAGLHSHVIERILEVQPPQIIYLSCNPSTQARDVTLLHDHYKVELAQGYNFFPRTPHIESLIVLDRRYSHENA